MINIDETWLNQMEFCRYKWCRKGEKNSLPVKQMQPRISMIVALASTGEVYCALTQVNTDSDVISHFMGRLANELEIENPDFRDHTVILLDNASYHRSDQTRAYVERLGLQVMLTAPYSYAGSPVELFFAYFK